MGRSTLIVGALCAVISAGVRQDVDLLVEETQSRASRCSEISGAERAFWDLDKCVCKTKWQYIPTNPPYKFLPSWGKQKYNLDGDDLACGQGVSRIFNLNSVSGKGCSCRTVKGDGCPLPKGRVQWSFKETNFNLDTFNTFISGRWYAQQQMETKDFPARHNYCVTNTYTKREKKTRFGYDIALLESAANSDGNYYWSFEFCAFSASKVFPFELKVAPCSKRKSRAGRYWIIAHNEEKGYALVSGGEPNLATTEGCRWDKGANGNGLWLFTREIEVDSAIILRMRTIASRAGFDLRVLNNVSHNVCQGKPGYP